MHPLVSTTGAGEFIGCRLTVRDAATRPAPLGVLLGKLESMATILIVEDRPLERKLLTRILRTQGHEIVEASDGREALVSGYPDDDAIVHQAGLAADIVFLQKPFTADGLLCRVREALDR